MCRVKRLLYLIPFKFKLIIRFIKLISVFMNWFFNQKIFYKSTFETYISYPDHNVWKISQDLQLSRSYFKFFFVFFEKKWTVRFAAYIWHRTQLVDLGNGVRDPAPSGKLTFFKFLIPIFVYQNKCWPLGRGNIKHILKRKARALDPSQEK